MKDKYFAADIFIKKYLIIPYIVENTKTIYYASGKKIILQWNFIFACLIVPSLISNKTNGKAKNKKNIYVSRLQAVHNFHIFFSLSLYCSRIRKKKQLTSSANYKS